MLCLSINDREIDDITFKIILSSNSDKFKDVGKLDLSNNRLTYESIEVLINNISAFPNLQVVELKGNEIGDEGMKILCPYLHLLVDNFILDCSNMGLTSEGLKYLADALHNVNRKIRMLDISKNKADSDGINDLVKSISMMNQSIMLIS